MRYVPAWLPGAGWKQKAKLYRTYVEEMLRAPFDLVKQQMVSGYIVHAMLFMYSQTTYLN